MFKNLSLKPTYSSYEDNIGARFYSPVLAVSIRYDRASAYFSAKSLAYYGKGLEMFGRKGNCFRLIVSSKLSQDDFEQISQGYALKTSMESKLLTQLQEALSLEEEKQISNLAYLISLGIIDIKIAYTVNGIFHDKFGIMEDAEGEFICFRGSNNETDAAFQKNYEAFDITCSWQASPFDYEKITKSKQTFEKLWTNQVENIWVCDLSQAMLDNIVSYSKGRIIVDKTYLEENCYLLDLDDKGLSLTVKIEKDSLRASSTYKLKLKRYVNDRASSDKTIIFKNDLTYPVFKKIIDVLTKDSEKKNYRFFVTEKVLSHIEQREMYIRERAQLGLSIKNKDPIVTERYEAYKTVVNAALTRPLREMQMWDSFFMYTMRKCSNFSVPGSGKTASVLGVFAFLQSKGLVKRIVMVGPKNSFGSWHDEFINCFGDKQELKMFHIHDTAYVGTRQKKSALLYDTGDKNLLLFNYESIESYIEEIGKIITKDTLLVFDEVHKVKAIGGQRASLAVKLSRYAQYIIALTGTPIPNSYSDIYNLLDILYHDEYNDFFGFSEGQLKNPSDQDIEEINHRLQPFFCRTTKEQLQVPSANSDIIVEVPASDVENQLLHILRLRYKKNRLALIIRILQLESNVELLLRKLEVEDFRYVLDDSVDIDEIEYVDLTDEVLALLKKVKETSKLKSCMALAESLYQQGKTVIIWCIFRNSIQKLKQKLSELGANVGCIYGDVSQEERLQIIDQFRKGEFQFLITNPHTLAESVSLHSVCHDAIYFEYSYNLVHLLQSKDRIHRLGLPSDQYTQYYYLQQSYLTKENEVFSLGCAIHQRLEEKEKIMLDAIENGVLEQGTTIEEDMDIIFEKLGL